MANLIEELRRAINSRRPATEDQIALLYKQVSALHYAIEQPPISAQAIELPGKEIDGVVFTATITRVPEMILRVANTTDMTPIYLIHVETPGDSRQIMVSKTAPTYGNTPVYSIDEKENRALSRQDLNYLTQILQLDNPT